MVSVKHLSAFLTIIPFVSCFSLEALKETPEYQQLLLLPNKYPVLTDFVNNAITRYEQQNNASSFDLIRFDAILEMYQSKFIELVNDELFFDFCFLLRASLKQQVMPVLGWVSIYEFGALLHFIEENPEKYESLAEDTVEILKFIETFLTEKRTALLQLDTENIKDAFETPEFQKLQSIPAKYPAFVAFVKKVFDRYQNGHVVSDADIFRFEIFLMGLQFQFVEFVNSPKFLEYAEIIKEQIRKVAIPVLGVIPMRDIEKLADTIEEDEELQISMGEDLASIYELCFAFYKQQRDELLKLSESKFGSFVVSGARRVLRAIIAY